VLDVKTDEWGRPLSDLQREKAIEKERDRIAGILKRLGNGEPSAAAPDTDVPAFAALFGPNAKPGDFLAAADRIRTQGGLLESFREGIVRSGAVLDETRRIFRAHGLPEDLVYLAHVESSFNWKAVSRAGAVGVWQFTKPTARLFLSVNDAVDERKDPLFAAEAAARLLKRNFRATGNWPLAVTAYNHGLLAIRKAMQEHDSNDLMHLILAYDAKPFGFASKNFYAEFLAAICVARDPAAFFVGIAMDPPLASTVVDVPVPLRITEAECAFAAGRDTLAALNPALLRAVLDGRRDIPRGFRLRVPAGTDVATAYARLTSRGLLPRGATAVWCRTDDQRFLPYIESTGTGKHAEGPAA
jgi:membrane-bound lytic murein transglycosylase D